MNVGKVLGVILIVAGIGIFVVGAAWAFSGAAQTRGGSILCLSIVFIITMLIVGVGIFLFIRGQREAVEFAEVEKERKLLGMVQAQGEARISDVALELDASRDQVKEWVYDLVHKGLFAGYINWDDGLLYSRDAAKLRGNKCPSCGGEVELAGKGVIQCPYCGAEIFLTG